MNPTEGDEETKRRPGQKERLLAQLNAGMDFFHSPAGEPYVTLRRSDRSIHLHLDDLRFSQVLTRDYWAASGGKDVPSTAALTDTINLAKARAVYGPEHPVFRRIAEHQGTIYLDLCNDQGEAIRLVAGGWEICTDPPVRFIRAPGMQPLPRPEKGGRIDALRPFLNAQDESDWCLIVVWLLACLLPKGPYPILILYGGEGTAKSTATRILRALVDPNVAGLRSLPSGERDLALAATNGHLLAFDNVSSLGGMMSDALCRIATGGGYGTRKLYTDTGETLLSIQRPIIMNGIVRFVGRSDLQSRCLVIELPRISEAARRSEQEFSAQWEQVRPVILGAFLDALAEVLEQLPKVKAGPRPRMADFANLGIAAERALRWPEGSFLAAYQRNLAGGAFDLLEENVLAQELIKLVSDTPWEGTPTELFSKLWDGMDGAWRPRDFPGSADALGKELTRLTEPLRAAGIEVRRWKGKRRVIRISRLPEPQAAGEGSASTRVSEASMQWQPGVVPETLEPQTIQRSAALQKCTANPRSADLESRSQGSPSRATEFRDEGR